MSHDNKPFLPGQLDLFEDQLKKENTTMGTINYVVADVRTYQDERSENKTVLIPHCCNNLAVMGAGVAKALKDMWPDVFTTYSKNPQTLGNVTFVAVEFDEFKYPSKFVVNMIGQDGIGSSNDQKPVRYTALMDAMRKTVKDMAHYKVDNPIIHAPLFGSKLAGGSWKLIEELITEIWLPHMDVTICVIDENEIPVWRRNNV